MKTNLTENKKLLCVEALKGKKAFMLHYHLLYNNTF